MCEMFIALLVDDAEMMSFTEAEVVAMFELIAFGGLPIISVKSLVSFVAIVVVVEVIVEFMVEFNGKRLESFCSCDLNMAEWTKCK